MNVIQIKTLILGLLLSTLSYGDPTQPGLPIETCSNPSGQAMCNLIDADAAREQIENKFNLCKSKIGVGTSAEACNQRSQVEGLSEYLNGVCDITSRGGEGTPEANDRQAGCDFITACNSAGSTSDLSNSTRQAVCRGFVRDTAGDSDVAYSVNNYLNMNDGQISFNIPESVANEAVSQPKLERAIVKTAKFFSGSEASRRLSFGNLDLFGGATPSIGAFTNPDNFGNLVSLCGEQSVWREIKDSRVETAASSPIEGSGVFIESWSNPYKMYDRYGTCTEAFGEEFFVRSDAKADTRQVLIKVCKDLMVIYGESIKRQSVDPGAEQTENNFRRLAAHETLPEDVDRDELQFFHYFGQVVGQPSQPTPTGEATTAQSSLYLPIYQRTYDENQNASEQTGKIVISDEVKTAAVKTFYSLISPCAGFKHIVERVDDTYDDNQGVAGVRGGNEVCFVRKDGDTNNPKSSLDYGDCKRALQWLGADDIGAAIIPTATSAFGAARQQDIQSDARSEAASGNPVAAQEAQRRTYQAQRDTHLINAGARGTFGAGILHSAFTYNTPENTIRKNCLNEDIGTEDDLRLDEDLFCPVAKLAQWDERVAQYLWTNQHMRQQMGTRAANSLMSALVDGIMAYLANKNANDVQDVIDTFENAEFNKPENQIAVEPRNCIINPDDPRCPNTNLGRVANTGGVDFQFSGTPQGGGGNGLDFLSEDEFNPDGGGNALSDGDIDNVADLSNVGAGSSDNKTGDDFNRVAAAGGTSAGFGGGGGGGGGGTGGGGGGGGGPAAEKGGAGGPTGNEDLGGRIAPKYITGQNGNLRPGGSAQTASKKDPFAALRKKSQRGPSSVIDNSIKPKTSKLFEDISRRYAAAVKDGKIK